ncbi:hypothetical protein GCM10009549_51590 [Streptomyces thermoalcalitolerans]|uniref:Uncharacterized protein n=2 Tax=Streptomyces thermoalcalitolerans TaxID=65605 RepID=A0ABN1PIX3_9ACTN
MQKCARPTSRMRRRPMRRTGQMKGLTAGTGMTGKQVLMTELAVVGGLVLALLIREMPGLVREIRIWRMVGFGSGPRRRR